MNELSARIKLYKGGRRAGIQSGYIATLRIDGLYTAAGIYLKERESLEPGDACEVKLLLPNPGYTAGKLTQGAKFSLTEGEREVGEGCVTATEE